MIDSKRLLVYGLASESLSTITRLCEDKPYRVISAAAPFEIITTHYFAAILVQDALDDAALKDILTFFREVDGESNVKFVVSHDDLLWKEATNAYVFEDASALLDALPTLLKKAYDRAKRAETLASNMNTSHAILAYITMNPHCTTGDIAFAIGRSIPACKRYIEELRLSGRPITYDCATKGWVLNSFEA